MPTASVTCPACSLRETFDRLAPARSLIEDHREATGYEADWRLGRVSPGVERAGDEAGVCGRPSCTSDSPLSRIGGEADSDLHPLEPLILCVTADTVVLERAESLGGDGRGYSGHGGVE
jgi:hypothetical protein